MNEANYASLTAGLLARKGQAKPAMRPQSYGFGNDDDLGWNDMGGADLLTPEQRYALMPAPPEERPQALDAGFPHPASAVDLPVASPALAQQEQVTAQFAAPAAEAVPIAVEPPAPQTAAAIVQPVQQIAVTPPRPRAAPGSKAKAAFTLRLDPERHMQLRLACVYGRKSAQQLVTAALDEYLAANFPDALKGGRKSAAN